MKRIFLPLILAVAMLFTLAAPANASHVRGHLPFTIVNEVNFAMFVKTYVSFQTDGKQFGCFRVRAVRGWTRVVSVDLYPQIGRAQVRLLNPRRVASNNRATPCLTGRFRTQNGYLKVTVREDRFGTRNDSVRVKWIRLY